jgi:indolepyruvate ferredoxin oxidoreductase beta subunit
MKSWSILIAGVGGQGTLLASKILGALAQAAGYDVKVSEVHGMAQRGGSVLTYVKMAQEVHSPIIEPGGADALLAFEQLEALRYAPYVRPGGTILVNTQKILPMPVIMGRQPYPDDIIGKLGQYNCTVIAVDALERAQRAGSARAVNTVMLGALSGVMGIDAKLWEDALAQCVPAKVLEVNRKAFNSGRG